MHFSRSVLEETLAQLAGPLRVAFASAAAERLRSVFAEPAARMGSRRGDALAQWLDVAWRSVTGDSSREEVIDSMRQIRDLVDRVAQGLEEVNDLKALPDEPLFAVMNALQTGLTHDATSAAAAAEWVYNFLDSKIAQRPGMPEHITGKLVPAYNQRIESDPLVQAELTRQRADIAVLSQVVDKDLAQLIEGLRARARAAAAELLEAR